MMSLESAQKKINYTFANVEHLNLALTAAHRSDLDGIANDGNRGLSQMGLSVLDLIETHNTVFVEKGTRSKFCSIDFRPQNLSRVELANTRRSWVKNKNDRAEACKKLGLHQHIVLSVRQQEPSSNVLANTLSAIFGAIWVDLNEQQRSVSDIIQQISAVLRYVESVIGTEPTFGHSTSEEGGFQALEGNEGIPQRLTPIQWNLCMPSEGFPNPNNFLDLPAPFSYNTEDFQESTEMPNETLRAIEPLPFYFSDANSTFELALMDKAQGKGCSQDGNVTDIF